ncbi:MAG TPA: hypothetical protein VK803_12300 [Steroidobacteraceae bacterium]|jgi:hypothetical protein|nr:hypothetical protein [Steroidobacteraceae bacterium]
MIGTNMLQPTFPQAPPAGRSARAPRAATGVRLLAAVWALASALALAAPPAAAPPAPAQSSAPASAVAPAATAPAPAPGAAAAAAAPASNPAPGEAPAETRSLDEDIQGLKKDVVDLNKDLFILEEELLFPANTQVAVFLSVDVGDFFALDSVQLKIDQKEVINYLYTPREVEALLKGGVQRLYIGNLKVGPHELVAFFNGKGPNDRPYKRGASLRFEKGVGAKYLELKIDDRQRKLQPEFEIKDWE